LKGQCYAKANLSAKKEKAQESPRISVTHEHTWWKGSYQSQKAKRQESPGGGLISASSEKENPKPTSRGIKKEQRLRTKADFQRAYSSGRSHSNHLLVLRSIRNSLGITRFGFVVSKRLGKAVQRNTLRRRLKEIVRLLDIEDGYDLVFITRVAAKEASFQQLQQAVHDLLYRSKLLVEREQG